MIPPHPISTLFPYTTLFRSAVDEITPNPWKTRAEEVGVSLDQFIGVARSLSARGVIGRFSTFLEHVKPSAAGRSEEHTSELQSRLHLVCRLLLEKKKSTQIS